MKVRGERHPTPVWQHHGLSSGPPVCSSSLSLCGDSAPRSPPEASVWGSAPWRRKHMASSCQPRPGHSAQPLSLMHGSTAGDLSQ